MEYKRYDPVVSPEIGHDGRKFWNVKFADHNGNPRNVACNTSEEAERICRLIRVAGDLVVEPFQICPLDVGAGKVGYMTLGHIDRSLFAALVNYEFETSFDAGDVEHSHVRPTDTQTSPSHRFSFERCRADDRQAMAATVAAIR